jgi:hypothetical protein
MCNNTELLPPAASLDYTINEITPKPVIYRTLSHVARRFPPNKGNRPVHPSSLTRWILDGIRLSDGSRIRLRGVRFPSGWRNTDEWIEDFLESLTAARTCSRLMAGRTGSLRSPARRQREHLRAKRELKTSGF